jgi:hypothetical protein
MYGELNQWYLWIVVTSPSGLAWTTQMSSTSTSSPSLWYQFCSISISGGSAVGKETEKNWDYNNDNFSPSFAYKKIGQFSNWEDLEKKSSSI